MTNGGVINWLIFSLGYIAFSGLVLAFLRGATYKGNIAEDPKYYGKAKND
jgi:hypothetical protein